jgi:predicted O-methyltransferase YrrM
LVEAKEKYDFIFLDAAKAQYMNFLPELMKLIYEGGLLITDNVLQDGTVINSRYSITRRDRTIHTRMREYLYTITHMDELETLILPIGDGIALSYRKEEEYYEHR